MKIGLFLHKDVNEWDILSDFEMKIFEFFYYRSKLDKSTKDLLHNRLFFLNYMKMSL